MRRLNTFLLIFFISFTSSQWDDYEGCPPGWTRITSSCYRAFREFKTWSDARDECQKEGSHLVSIKDPGTNTKIIEKLTRNGDATEFWIGAESSKSTNSWTWTDGSNFQFHNFKQDDRVEGECARIDRRNGRWKEISKSSCRFQTSPYICKLTAEKTRLDTTFDTEYFYKTTEYLTTEYGTTFYETTDLETTDYEAATDEKINPGMGIDVLTTTTTTTGPMVLSNPAPDGGEGSENLLFIGLGTGGL